MATSSEVTFMPPSEHPASVYDNSGFLTSSESNQDSPSNHHISNDLVDCVMKCDENKRDYHFIMFPVRWYLLYTRGRRNLTFDDLVEAVIYGLEKENGRIENGSIGTNLDGLKKIKDDSVKKSEKENIDALEKCCANLYTKQSFIYSSVNTAIDNNDATKLETLGPYSYLLFNYVAHDKKQRSFMDRVKRLINITIQEPLTLYRVGQIDLNTLSDYRNAINNRSNSFKWDRFTSTSRYQEVAEKFEGNVLYMIELKTTSLLDQFKYLKPISQYPHEEEYLLLPGTRFCVKGMIHDHAKQRHRVYVKVIPSFVSTL